MEQEELNEIKKLIKDRSLDNHICVSTDKLIKEIDERFSV